MKTDVAFENKMRIYKTTDRIISSISDNILGTCPEYDFFDVTLTPEFFAIEKLVSILVEKSVSGHLERGAYVKYCKHCEGEES